MQTGNDYLWFIVIGAIPVIVMLLWIFTDVGNWFKNRKSIADIEEEAYEKGWNAAVNTMKNIQDVAKQKKQE